MKQQTFVIKALSLILASAILFAGCASTTMIQSKPSDAKIYIDGQAVGQTPYTHTDTKIVGSGTIVKLEKEGYEPLNVTFYRSEQADAGAIIGGIFLLVPFLWTMKYNPVHEYELVPLKPNDQSIIIDKSQESNINVKADKLRVLKQLLEDKVITQEEFEKEKAKILTEENK
jgi:hypothetical protein